jgi:hypothetical protein
MKLRSIAELAIVPTSFSLFMRRPNSPTIRKPINGKRGIRAA